MMLITKIGLCKENHILFLKTLHESEDLELIDS